MVAVKALWELWKTFTDSVSFSSKNQRVSSSSKSVNENSRVGYSRLRPRNKNQLAWNFIEMSERKKSQSLPLSNSFPQNQTESKSKSNVDQNGNRIDNELSLGIAEEEIGWRYDFDNSDSDYCDDDYDEDIPTDPEDSLSDFGDDEEELTCDVCDRAFESFKNLAHHQEKKRHFGCLQCDSLFPSREALTLHRDEMDHYDYYVDSSLEDDDDEYDDLKGCHPADKLLQC